MANKTIMASFMWGEPPMPEQELQLGMVYTSDLLVILGPFIGFATLNSKYL